MKLRVLIAFIFITNSLLAQNGRIKGSVLTSDGHPATFVNVLIKNSNKGGTTDAAGSFEIRNLSEGQYTLQVSFVGLESKEVLATVTAGQTTLLDAIVLSESSEALQEVTIAGSRGYREDLASRSLRIATPLIEVPQNVQVVTRQLLADQQVFDILDGITRNVSGAQRLEHWDNYARINMRGTQITAFRNGLNVAMPWGPLAEDMSMVERIEFVKGPAGFMISNGEPGGFYNVVTKKPTGLSKGEVTFSLGSFNNYRSTVDLDGRLSQNGKLLYRLNVMGNAKESHRDYEFNNRYTIVPVLKYLIHDRTSVTLEFTHQFSQMSAIGSNYAFSRNGYEDLPRNFTTAEPNLAPSEVKDNSVLLIFEHGLNDRWNVTGQLAYFNYNQIGQSLWPRSLSENGDMQRGVSIWDALGTNKTAQLFIQGREQTGSITHRLLAGIDMSNKDYYADWNQSALLGGVFNIYAKANRKVAAAEIPVFDRSLNIRERGVQYATTYSALYVQDELGFFDNTLRLTLAGRYTHAINENPYSGNTDDRKFTPRLGLSYSVNSSTSIYAVFDEAFLPNPGTDYSGKSFDPVTGENLEVGLKKDIFDGRWNVGLTTYQITKNNVLVQDTENRNADGQFVFQKQVGQTRTKGVEFDLRGEIVKNLEVVFNYAYTQGEITEDTNEANIGSRLPGISTHLTNTWLTYRLNTNSALKGLGFSLGYQWQIERSSWFVFDGTEQSLPDYFRMDGGVSYASNKFNVAFNINNILDARLYSGAPYDLDYDGVREAFYYQVEAPTNFRLTVGYKF